MNKKIVASLGLLLSPFAAFANNLIVCTEASPDGFDVVQFNSLVTTQASADVIFNGLVRYDETEKSVKPSLAKNWTISDDGLTYLFDLHDNVVFHSNKSFTPSRTLNADDVLFSFNRMLDKNHPWHKVVGATGFPHAQSFGLAELIKSIEKTGTHQVKIELTRPDATFLPLLTMGFTSIYSAEYADLLAKENRFNELNTQPIGTGPFSLRQYTKDANIRYIAHKEYFEGEPPVKQLVYAITPDAAVRTQKVEAGECHIAVAPKPSDVKLAIEKQHINVNQVPAFSTAYVALNTQKAPFDNVLVRQAVNYAFDKKSYNQAVFEGTAIEANTPYPPNTWSFNDKIIPYEYNVEKAKSLLEQAGLKDGFKTTIWVRPTGSVLNPNPKLGAEMLQADLKKVGIDASIQVIEWGELIQSAKKGEHDILFMGWGGDNGDPDNFLTPQFSCNAVQSGTNFARFCDQKLHGLIEQGKTTSDIATRTALYEEAQQIIHDQALWIPLAHPTASTLLRKEVKGYQTSPFARQHLSQVSVE
ncbi:ABC transporter substrate-binding protein [Thorsellia kenyensis]|uniref:ABC transporter substrate-binding protein n=1 Tax=Thorsellia kenyensis TaxID=1549888 RepID=A0ABV6CDE0_9GAMM